MALATALAAGALATSTIGVGMQAKSAHDQRKAQARIGDFNARAAERDALAEEQATTFEQVQQRRKGRRIMGALRARLGASGAALDEGAPLRLQAEQLFELELENALIGQQGRVKAGQLRTQGYGYQMGAAADREAASNALTAGYLNMGATILQGVGSMYKQGMFSGGGKGYYSGSAPGD